MIRRPRRLPAVKFVIALGGAATCAAGQPGAPVTAKDVILKTMTPLGEAAIVRPAGSVLAEPLGTGSEILVRQGPFTARVDRAEVVFPTPTPAPAAEGMPSPTPAARSEDAPSGLKPTAWLEDWRIAGPAGAAVLLGLYSLVATIALVRGRRKVDE